MSRSPQPAAAAQRVVPLPAWRGSSSWRLAPCWHAALEARACAGTRCLMQARPPALQMAARHRALRCAGLLRQEHRVHAGKRLCDASTSSGRGALSCRLTRTPAALRALPCAPRAPHARPLRASTQVYELDGTDLKLSKETEKPSAFKCGTFGASSLVDRHLATGNFAGQLQIWDLENTAKPIFDVQAHASIVNQMDGFGGQASKHPAACTAAQRVLGVLRLMHARMLAHACDMDARVTATQARGYGAPEIATCGRDGCVRVWDVRQQDAPVAAFEPADTGNIRDCW